MVGLREHGHKERPLDDEEIAQFRKMQEEWERCKWLYALTAKVSAWTGGVVISMWALRDFLTWLLKAVKAFFSTP